MALFKYKAIDASGKYIQGSLDAGNISDLENRLEKMSLDLVSCKQKQPGADIFGRNQISRSFSKVAPSRRHCRIRAIRRKRRTQ